MGVNNRTRRASKKRRRGRGRTPRPGGGRSSWPYAGESPPHAHDEHALADGLVVEAADACRAGPHAAPDLAQRLLSEACPVAPAVVAAAMNRLLLQALQRVSHAGWSPRDQAELVRRRLTPEHLPLLARGLRDEAKRHAADRVALRWLDELATLGPPEHPALRNEHGLALALALVAVLGTAPAIAQLVPPPGIVDLHQAARPHPETHGHAAKLLARVRALLAKAESTDFPEEAEAFSAKAQELISRHSLDRLLTGAERSSRTRSDAVVARRLWIDAPYVMAKARLADAVGRANRCSTVVSEKLGFATVVGAPGDLDAVELLTTSLLVQANTGLLRAGRRTDSYGATRTTSFRRSFLLSYAHRIGERLTEADGPRRLRPTTPASWSRRCASTPTGSAGPSRPCSPRWCIGR